MNATWPVLCWRPKLTSLYPASPLSKKGEKVKNLLLHSKKFAVRTRRAQRKLKFSSSECNNGNTESDQRFLSPSTLALPTASSRCLGKGNMLSLVFWPSTGSLQHPSQRFYSNHYAVWFVLFRARFSYLYTLKLPGRTRREQSSFIVTQYVTGTAASYNGVRGDLASSVPEPTWQILCNVHFGLPLQFLAALVIFFLAIAYVSSRMLFLMRWIPACRHGGLPCFLQLHNPYGHSWVYWWHCLQDGGPVLNIRSNTGINTAVSCSHIPLLTFPCAKFALRGYCKPLHSRDSFPEGRLDMYVSRKGPSSLNCLQWCTGRNAEASGCTNVY